MPRKKTFTHELWGRQWKFTEGAHGCWTAKRLGFIIELDHCGFRGFNRKPLRALWHANLFQAEGEPGSGNWTWMGSGEKRGYKDTLKELEQDVLDRFRRLGLVLNYEVE